MGKGYQKGGKVISTLKFWPNCDINLLDLWVASLGVIYKKIGLEFDSQTRV